MQIAICSRIARNPHPKIEEVEIDRPCRQTNTRKARDAVSVLGMSPRSAAGRAALGPLESKERPPKVAVEADGGVPSAAEWAVSMPTRSRESQNGS